MKSIIQSEAAECGLASLAMIAARHGKHITLSELRNRFPLSLKGAKLSSVISIAQQLGFSARPLRLEPPDLAKLAMPCILHWDMDHFVVLDKVRTSGITIFDPARGKRIVRALEISSSFTGIALELTPNSEFQQQSAPLQFPYDN